MRTLSCKKGRADMAKGIENSKRNAQNYLIPIQIKILLDL
jgi:hypothetical protein